MSEYRLIIGQTGGTGNIRVNGSPVAPTYTEGSVLEIAIALDDGYVGVSWYRTPNYTTPLATTLTFQFTMPSEDVKLRADISGEYSPIDGYGDKYTYTKETLRGEAFKIVIQERGYGGLTEERKIVNARYTFGRRGIDLQRTWVSSALRLQLIANETDLDYDELLTADSRKYRCVLYLKGSSDAFFTGYISPNQLTRYVDGNDYVFNIVALDGIQGFGSVRALAPRYLQRPMNENLSGLLNQTYEVKRPMRVASRVYESRMVRTKGSLDQLLAGQNTLYKDGDVSDFIDGVNVVNETLYLSEFGERMLNPFVGRLYLWEDTFYFTRWDEYSFPDMEYWEYDEDGAPVGKSTVTNDGTFNCINGDGEAVAPEEVKSLSYNEFTAYLQFGEFQGAVKTGVMDFAFDADDWTRSPVSQAWSLKFWGKKNAEWVDRVGSRPTGTTASIQYITGDFEGVKIWGTSSLQGYSDPNLSSISVLSNSVGGDFSIVRENANKISIEFEYTVQNVRSDGNAVEGSGQYELAFECKIGDGYWLHETATPNVFDFITTPSHITIRLLPNADNVVKKVTIGDVIVPADGVLGFTFFQLFPLTTQGVNEYTLLLRNFKLSIEENEALTLNELGVKGTTDLDYNLVYDDYDTYHGDAETAQSTSALRLNVLPDYPVTESWSRDGVESIALLQVVVQDLGNRLGRPQLLLYGITDTKPDPTRGVSYDGKQWAITYIEYDVFLDYWKVELWQM